MKAMAKKVTQKTPPATATAGVVGGTWNLGTDFQTVQIIPATGYWATYKDGGRYPVVAWAMQARLVREDERDDWGDDEVPPGFVSRVVGLVMRDKDAPLTEADDYGIGGEDFAGYEWNL
jgi:hypothetical protein